MVKALAAGGLTLHLPDYLELSGFHQVTDNLALHYSYKFTHWSRFKELHATFMTVSLLSTKMKNIVAILVMH